MIFTPHLIVGAAIGSKFQNIFLIGFLALLSHYLMDALPHLEYPAGKELKRKGIKASSKAFMMIFADFCFGTFLALYLCRANPRLDLVILGMFLSVLPDGVRGVYFLFKNWLEKLSAKNIVGKIIFRSLALLEDIHCLLHCPKIKKIPSGIRIFFHIGVLAQIIVSLIGIVFILE